MTIPKLHYISEGNTPEEHRENIQNACTSGVELVQLCLKQTSEYLNGENVSMNKFIVS